MSFLSTLAWAATVVVCIVWYLYESKLAQTKFSNGYAYRPYTKTCNNHENNHDNSTRLGSKHGYTTTRNSKCSEAKVNHELIRHIDELLWRGFEMNALDIFLYGWPIIPEPFGMMMRSYFQRWQCLNLLTAPIPEKIPGTRNGMMNVPGQLKSKWR